MPYRLRKKRNSNPPCYEVKNIESGKVHASCTTKEKAMKQLELLNKLKVEFDDEEIEIPEDKTIEKKI